MGRATSEVVTQRHEVKRRPDVRGVGDGRFERQFEATPSRLDSRRRKLGRSPAVGSYGTDGPDRTSAGRGLGPLEPVLPTDRSAKQNGGTDRRAGHGVRDRAVGRKESRHVGSDRSPCRVRIARVSCRLLELAASSGFRPGGAGLPVGLARVRPAGVVRGTRSARRRARVARSDGPVRAAGPGAPRCPRGSAPERRCTPAAHTSTAAAAASTWHCATWSEKRRPGRSWKS